MKPDNFRIAVIVTTYNRLDALALVLDGFLAQSDRDFELLVADDGSTADTAELVREYQARAPFKLTHVWQEDIGFRAAAARNRALAQTDADYIVFTDGDCVPPTGFVAAQRELAEPGWFLSGNRMLLSESFTQQVVQNKTPIYQWSKAQLLRAVLRGDLNRWLPLLRLPDWDWLRKRTPQRWQGAKTCNLAAWRADLLRVNGLDESYTGWGLEDSDLVIRLLRAGVQHKSGRFAVPVFHLWHRENDRSRLEENQRKLDALLAADHVRAKQGLDQYQ